MTTLVDEPITAPTMEEILQSIKGSIIKEAHAQSYDKSEDEDVLELVDPIEAPPLPRKPASDLLSKIDKALLSDVETDGADNSHYSHTSVRSDSTQGVVKPVPHSSFPCDSSDEPAASPSASNTTSTVTLDEHLISQESAKKSVDALKELKDKINAVPHMPPQRTLAQDVTLEDLVTQALRPYLGAWLDKHLPVIVERAVKEEIQKLVYAQESM